MEKWQEIITVATVVSNSPLIKFAVSAHFSHLTRLRNGLLFVMLSLRRRKWASMENVWKSLSIPYMNISILFHNSTIPYWNSHSIPCSAIALRESRCTAPYVRNANSQHADKLINATAIVPELHEDRSLLPARRNSTFRSGRFGLGHFGLETFRSDYEILQKSYMLTFSCKCT